MSVVSEVYIWREGRHIKYLLCTIIGGTLVPKLAGALGVDFDVACVPLAKLTISFWNLGVRAFVGSGGDGVAGVSEWLSIAVSVPDALRLVGMNSCFKTR